MSDRGRREALQQVLHLGHLGQRDHVVAVEPHNQLRVHSRHLGRRRRNCRCARVGAVGCLNLETKRGGLGAHAAEDLLLDGCMRQKRHDAVFVARLNQLRELGRLSQKLGLCHEKAIVHAFGHCLQHRDIGDHARAVVAVVSSRAELRKELLQVQVLDVAIQIGHRRVQNLREFDQRHGCRSRCGKKGCHLDSCSGGRQRGVVQSRGA